MGLIPREGKCQGKKVKIEKTEKVQLFDMKTEKVYIWFGGKSAIVWLGGKRLSFDLKKKRDDYLAWKRKRPSFGLKIYQKNTKSFFIFIIKQIPKKISQHISFLYI